MNVRYFEYVRCVRYLNLYVVDFVIVVVIKKELVEENILVWVMCFVS